LFAFARPTHLHVFYLSVSLTTALGRCAIFEIFHFCVFLSLSSPLCFSLPLCLYFLRLVRCWWQASDRATSSMSCDAIWWRWRICANILIPSRYLVLHVCVFMFASSCACVGVGVCVCVRGVCVEVWVLCRCVNVECVSFVLLNKSSQSLSSVIFMFWLYFPSISGWTWWVAHSCADKRPKQGLFVFCFAHFWIGSMWVCSCGCVFVCFPAWCFLLIDSNYV
jgi:hypothetical protein